MGFLVLTSPILLQLGANVNIKWSIFYSNMKGGIFVHFAENLKRIQESAHLSNYKMAKFLGCSQTSISNWINDETFPHEKARRVIAEAFGLSLSDIDGELPNGWKEIVAYKIKKPAPTVSGDGLSENEKILVSAFRALPKESQEDVLAQIQGILERHGLLPKRCIRHRNIFASARRTDQAY